MEKAVAAVMPFVKARLAREAEATSASEGEEPGEGELTLTQYASLLAGLRMSAARAVAPARYRVEGEQGLERLLGQIEAAVYTWAEYLRSLAGR